MEQLHLYSKRTSGAVAFLAKTSRWRAEAIAQGLKGRALDSFIHSLNLSAKLFPRLSSSRTCQVSFLPTEGEISRSFSRPWQGSGMLWDGVCLTADISESPNRAADSSLLDIIETRSVPPRYFLSPNAAAGMLRRANHQKRPLFPPLRKALETMSQGRLSSESDTV